MNSGDRGSKQVVSSQCSGGTTDGRCPLANLSNGMAGAAGNTVGRRKLSSTTDGRCPLANLSNGMAGAAGNTVGRRKLSRKGDCMDSEASVTFSSNSAQSWRQRFNMCRSPSVESNLSSDAVAGGSPRLSGCICTSFRRTSPVHMGLSLRSFSPNGRSTNPSSRAGSPNNRCDQINCPAGGGGGHADSTIPPPNGGYTGNNCGSSRSPGCLASLPSAVVAPYSAMFLGGGSIGSASSRRNPDLNSDATSASTSRQAPEQQAALGTTVPPKKSSGASSSRGNSLFPCFARRSDSSDSEDEDGVSSERSALNSAQIAAFDSDFRAQINAISVNISNGEALLHPNTAASGGGDRSGGNRNHGGSARTSEGLLALAGNGGAMVALPYPVHTQVEYTHYLVPELEKITAAPYYWGIMDRFQAERLLDGKPEGSFLLRDSAQSEYLFSVSFRRYGRTLHARIEHMDHRFSFDCYDPQVFSATTVTELIDHYKDPSACLFFEPLLSIPLKRRMVFPLQHLSRSIICSNISYNDIGSLALPKKLKQYLREYHYKQAVRVHKLEA